MTRAQFATVPVLGALLLNAGQQAAGAAPPYVFDRREFERRATLPFPHRQLFAARSLSSGVVLHLMQNSLKAYRPPNGFSDNTHSLHVAAVLYGTSIAALLTDRTWNDLGLADFLQRLGDLPAGKLTVNPYSEIVAELGRSDAVFFICNNALHDVAQALADSPSAAATNARDIYAALRNGVQPQALVVPAGVAAINALQEYRFTLVQATV